MKSFTFFHRIKNRIRLLNSSLKQNALRFYIGDLDKFYNSLKLEGVEYLILRWTDNFPKNKQEEELYNKLTKIMDKVAKVRKMCTCKENVSE